MFINHAPNVSFGQAVGQRFFADTGEYGGQSIWRIFPADSGLCLRGAQAIVGKQRFRAAVAGRDAGGGDGLVVAQVVGDFAVEGEQLFCLLYTSDAADEDLV